MSTYIAPVAQTSQYVSGIPLDLIMQVGAQKQSQYNNFRDTIQSEIDMIGSSDIIKESDREFINSKLQDTVNKMNEYTGSNLTNSGIQNELRGIVGSLKSDNDIYSRLVNNRKAASELRRINQLKQEGDETYNSSNEKVFMDQLNAWQNNPNQIQFNSTYTPYTDVHKIASEYIDPILKNPNIRQEIETFVDTDGIRKRRSETEIKEVTQERLMQALRGLPESAMRQLQIDYMAGKDNLSVQGALAGLQSRLESQTNNLTSLEEKLADPNLLPSTKGNIERLIEQTRNSIANIQGTANAVVANNDPTLYYTDQAYMQDRLYDLAQSYAYTQQDGTKIDPFFSKELDFNYAKELRAIDHTYDMEKEAMKARISAEKEAAKLAGGTSGVGLSNDYADQIYNVMTSGKGTFTQDQVLPMLNGVGKINDDGSAQLQLSGRRLYIDIAPTLEKAGVKLQDELQASAYQEAQEAYKKWGKRKENQVSTVSNDIRNRSNRTISGRLENSLNFQPKSFEEFLLTPEGKNLIEQTKQYNIDLSNKSDVANIKKYINSPEVQALSELFGKGLDNLVGTGNFTPYRQDNVLSDAYGDMYIKGTLRMNRADWITKFNGITEGDGEDLWDKLIDDGYIKYAQGIAGEDDAIAELTVTTKLDRDLNSAMEENLRKRFSGDKATAEQIPLYMNDFRNNMSLIRQTLSSIGTRNISSLAGRANENVYTLTKNMSGERKKAYQTLIEKSENILKDPDKTSLDKIHAYNAINKLGSVTLQQLEELEKEQQVTSSNPYSGNFYNYGKALPKAQEAFTHLNSKGLPNHISAAIIGNLMAESSLNSTIKNGIGRKGLAQWDGARYNALQKFAKSMGKSPDDFFTQLDFVVEEAKQRGDLDKMLKASSLQEATEIFTREYERPSEAEINKSIGQRIAYASQLYGK